MTEEEWLACSDPEQMLHFLRRKGSDRKFLLFACACCRRIWPLITDDRSRKAVEMMERDVEQPVGEPEYTTVFWDAQNATGDEDEDSEDDPAHSAAEAAYSTIPGSPNLERVFCAMATAAYAAKARLLARQAEEEAQADLLREMFGNPFRPKSVEPAWLTWNGGTVVKLGQGVYEERAFDRVPILADALEDAGCTDADILDHCRQPGPHGRGCWVVDLLTGRT
jgi:hypothetical protein